MDDPDKCSSMSAASNIATATSACSFKPTASATPSLPRHSATAHHRSSNAVGQISAATTSTPHAPASGTSTAMVKLRARMSQLCFQAGKTAQVPPKAISQATAKPTAPISHYCFQTGVHVSSTRRAARARPYSARPYSARPYSARPYSARHRLSMPPCRLTREPRSPRWSSRSLLRS